MINLRTLLAASSVLALMLGLFGCPPTPRGGDDDDAGSSDDDDDASDDDDDATDDDDDASDDDDNTGGSVLALCGDSGDGTMPVSGDLTCGDKELGLLFDVYTVTVEAGDCVWIFADNEGGGNADLLALGVDANQESFYGLADDWSQLDDEANCTDLPWPGQYGCPEASVTAETAGDFTVMVTQWGGETKDGSGACAEGAAYNLHVAVNGVDVTPNLLAEDQPLQ